MADDIVRCARTLPRDRFLELFTGFYLQVSGDAARLTCGSFETAAYATSTEPTGRFADGARALLGLGRGRRSKKPDDVRLVAIAKASGNPHADRVSVGRTANCDLVLRDPSVSKLHAHFRHERQGALVVMDARSANGTIVNGKTLEPGHPEGLASGDEVRFGAVLTTVLDVPGVYDLLQRL